MNAAPNNVEQRWLSYAQLAERMGVCERTIRRDVDAGNLPKPIKIRGCVRFDWPEVEAALLARRLG
jgi:predicted DNA-binding transcriptional regulator AlpA